MIAENAESQVAKAAAMRDSSKSQKKSALFEG